MYFSRQEFNADQETQAAAQRYAQEAVRLADQYFGVQLDGSSDSVSCIDPIFRRIREMLAATGITEQAAEPFVRPFGSYFGEVLRSRYGGEWGTLRIFSDEATAIRIGPKGIVLVPWTRALEWIKDDSKGSLCEYHQLVCRALEAHEAEPDPDEQIESGEIGRELYTLRHDQGYFETGTTADGRQVLTTGLTAIYFDRDGNLLEHEDRPLPVGTGQHPQSDLVPGHPTSDSALNAAIDAWKRDINFCAEPIRIRKFFIPDLGAGIEDYPDHYEEFLAAPELYEPDEEARREMFESVREWRESGSFVLYWGNDLWLDGEGKVTSS